MSSEKFSEAVATERVPVIVASDIICQLGENPAWDPERQTLYWTDILAGKIHALDVASGRHRLIYQGLPVGGFTLQTNGDLLLFRVNDIARLEPDGRVTPVRKFTHEGMHRFNDVIADPAGRVFAGTIGENPKCGLFRVDLDGTITHLFAGTGCSNGMGFSPSQSCFYWTCSTTRTIYQFDYDQATGEIRNQKVFYKESDPNAGLPDGLAIDTNGHIWSARWGGSAIIQHSANGDVLSRISFPAKFVTSLCFYGDGLQGMFVTSAKAKDSTSAADGQLFQITSEVQGRPKFCSQIKTA